jgi:hypothetical protein
VLFLAFNAVVNLAFIVVLFLAFVAFFITVEEAVLHPSFDLFPHPVNSTHRKRTLMKTNNTRVYKMSFAGVYPLYVEKVEKKGRTKEELDTVICWLTGYNKKSLQKQIDKKVDLETFFAEAKLNPNASKITGVICGYRIEDIEDPLMKKIRYMDKLVDELAKGRKMEKILRE